MGSVVPMQEELNVLEALADPRAGHNHVFSN